MTYADPEDVARQYRDASKLNARIALHDRFSTNAQGLQRWVFDDFELPDEASILDVGCGAGQLWEENLDRLPEGCNITPAHASQGWWPRRKAALGQITASGFGTRMSENCPARAGDSTPWSPTTCSITCHTGRGRSGRSLGSCGW